MDKIMIENLECYCHHGVLKEENVLGQKFLVTVCLYMDTRKAGKNDDLCFSVDYASVAHFIDDVMKRTEYKLIETVAEKLAREILYEFKIPDAVDVTIKKPWAPILLPLDTVSVSIHRAWTRVYVGVGSNIGNRRKYIDDAFAGIRNEKSCRKAFMSTIIETDPYGYTDQSKFLNGVISFETIYSPKELLRFLQKLEENGQRTRDIHWGPRTIDLDILLYGDEVIQSEELIVPHKEIHLRSFVLEPMNEIAPFAIHPVFGKTIAQMFYELNEKKEGQKNDD